MAHNHERDHLLRLCTRPTDKNVPKFLFYPLPAPLWYSDYVQGDTVVRWSLCVGWW